MAINVHDFIWPLRASNKWGGRGRGEMPMTTSQGRESGS